MAKLTRKQKNRLEKVLFKISPQEEKSDLAYHFSERLEKRMSRKLSAVSKDSVDLARYIKGLEEKVMDSLTSSSKVTSTVKKDIVDLVDALKISIGQDLDLRHKEYLNKNEEMRGLIKSFYEVHENMRREFDGKTTSTRKHIKRRIDDIMIELERIGNIRPNAWGGSSRTFYLNGVPASNRYSDVNFIAGTGITFSEVDNETTLRADVTVSASGSGTLTAETPSGTIDGVNTVFTIQHKPQLLFLNGAYQTISTDYTLTGSSAPYTINYTYAPTNPSTQTSLY